MERIPQSIIDSYLIKSNERNFISFADIYNSGKDIKIDIGSGNGHFLVDISLEQPDVIFIGVELKFERICKTISKLKKRNINNVKLFYGDAKLFFNEIVTDNAISEIYYNFPDPWPKRRHHKKRLINKDFLNCLYYKMKADAVFTCATDHKDYLDWMLSNFENDKRFKFVFKNKVVNSIDNYHSTLFEKLWKDMGKEIYYYKLIRL